MDTTSDSRTSSSIPPTDSWSPLCLHGFRMNILTSYTEKNPGRKFFTCSVRKYDDCDFFQWVDAPSSLSFCRNNCERRARMLEEDFQRQLLAKADAESVLTQNLKTKAEECDRLKLKVQKLKEKMEDMEAANEKKWLRVFVVMAIVIVLFAVGKA